MQGRITQERVSLLIKQFPEGSLVRCIKIYDPITIIPPGAIGMVQRVNDDGTILIRWMDGRFLGAIDGIDIVEPV